MDVEPSALADLVLCSHILYYINTAEWMTNLEKLVSWLAPTGALVVGFRTTIRIACACWKHFFGYAFDLPELGSRFEALRGSQYRVDFETVAVQVATPDFDSAFIIAEFMLNLLAIQNPPTCQSLEEYVRKHFVNLEGGFHFSCDQDFLTIRRWL
jgi:hypothetical protein